MERLSRGKNLVFHGAVGALLLTLILAACGGGGGTAPIANLVVNGTVVVPAGTPRSRDLSGGAPLPNAVVRAYLVAQPANPIAEGSTDSDGRYTLRLPPDAVGKDILIVAEKVVSGQRVRVSGLVASMPVQGYAGANLDVFSTLATEEILRYARAQNLSQLSPNGIAAIIDQVRERTRDLNALSLVVGQTLPETIGEGILDTPLRDRVRPQVEQYGNNLRPSTGDVAVAKSMMQMMRDLGLGATDRGEGETRRLERKVREQDEILHEDIVRPLDAFAERGFRFFERTVGLRRGVAGIEGLAPGRYREVGYYHRERIGNTDPRTWEILTQDGQLTCTVRTQNALQEFDPIEAGTITFSVRKQGDSRFQYDGALEAPQRDSQNNITRVRLNFTFTDSGLSQPIRVSGDLNAANYSGDTPRSLQFSGNLTSQFADLTITNLQATAYEGSGRLQQMSVGRIQAQLKSRRAVSVDLQNLTLSFRNTEPSGKDIQQITIGSFTATGVNSTIELRNWEIVFQRIGGYPGQLEPFPVAIRAQLVYRAPNDTVTGTVQGRWENPMETHLIEERLIPLTRFPRGSFTFNGRVEPAIGRPMGVQFTLTSAPNLAPPQVSLAPRFDLGAERMEGTIVGTLKVQSGLVDWERAFANVSVQMTHTPSNFRVQLTVSNDGRTVSGSIKKPDGAAVAQIGNADDLNLPDLGDQPIVRYSDGTFETLGSLLL
jgi:hypothetical protein